MKRTLLFSLFLYSCVSIAQIVNIPDPNFKADLIYQGVDSNNDGEIQVSEAVSTSFYFNTSETITDMTGIETFIHLNSLSIEDAAITSLNINGLTQLQTLRIRNTNLASLNISNLTGLTTFECRENTLLTALDVTNLTNLTYLNTQGCTLITALNLAPLVHLTGLNCSQNNIANLDLTTLLNLTSLIADGNPIITIDISSVPNLHYLNVTGTGISSLDLANVPNLNTLLFANTPMVSIDLSPVNLHQLYCSQTDMMSSLDLSAQTNLTDLGIGGQQLSNVDLSALANLTYLGIDGLQQNYIDFSLMPLLNQIDIDNSSITQMDFSHNYTIDQLFLGNNNALAYLNLKNGMYFIDFGISGSPNLLYVCVDTVPSQATYYFGPYALAHGNNPLCQLNPFCSFTPGGIYNTTTGTVRFDAGGNGCDSSDPIVSNFKIHGSAGLSQADIFTNNSGVFSILMQNGITLTPELENPGYFNVTPSVATVNFPGIDNSTQTQDFCISPNGVHNDVEVVVIAVTPPRPGFDAIYKIIYRNKGNQAVSGAITFVYDGSIFDFVTADTSPASNSEGSLTFDYTNLAPFEQREIRVTLNLNGPMDTPAVNIGDNVSSTATMQITGVADEVPDDNIFIFNQTVLGAFDPNDKQCLEGQTVTPDLIGDYLHYQVNFENTGNTAAQNITVRDQIDSSKFDLASLEVLSLSHPGFARIVGNTAEFIFDDINLEPDAKGYVIFKIKTKSTLTANAIVTNKADIFFDYNFPVATNTATTAFQLLGTKEFATDDSITVYPNPANNWVNVEAKGIVKSYGLFDIQGRILEIKQINKANAKIDISKHATGIYYLRIYTDSGMKTEKLIKN
ncbi:MAG TPA: T9SS type A sorting domain-containing protein [Flavobacterium sp.]|nr:T9SS type A sorting domain-containing protein [Flavobacterium sp.]